MAAAIVSESTIREYVEKASEEFEASLEAQFRELDADCDGLLSRADLRLALLQPLLPISLDHPAALSDPSHPDADADGHLDGPQFKAQMRDVLLAIAHGLRGCPCHMLLQSGSILHHAVLHEQESQPDSLP